MLRNTRKTIYHDYKILTNPLSEKYDLNLEFIDKVKEKNVFSSIYDMPKEEIFIQLNEYLKNENKGIMDVFTIEEIIDFIQKSYKRSKRKVKTDTIGKEQYMYDNWEELEKSIQGCKKCKLAQGRTNLVFGDGNKEADVMFIGEGPGADEDRERIPFVGKAGKLMNMAFDGLDIDREKVYIANIVKCRPPSNRNPEEEETVACMDYLRNQVLLVKPKIIVLLGSVALKNILGKDYGITVSRGNWIQKKGLLYMPTWHPAALLRDDSKKIEFWKDLKQIKEKAEELEIKIEK